MGGRSNAEGNSFLASDVPGGGQSGDLAKPKVILREGKKKSKKKVKPRPITVSRATVFGNPFGSN